MFLGELNTQTIQIGGHLDLATEPGCAFQAERQVEHIFLFFNGRCEFIVPIRVDNNVTG